MAAPALLLILTREEAKVGAEEPDPTMREGKGEERGSIIARLVPSTEYPLIKANYPKIIDSYHKARDIIRQI